MWKPRRKCPLVSLTGWNTFNILKSSYDQTQLIVFCLYLLPLCAILKEHNIGYHIYADDTQLYISFNSKEPLTSLTKLNNCISDIRVWMIQNKLKINDSKTEFIIFRSLLLKTDLSVCRSG